MVRVLNVRNIDWIEERYINWKTKMTVDKAIKDYNNAIDTDVVTPEVREHDDGSISIGHPFDKEP